MARTKRETREYNEVEGVAECKCVGKHPVYGGGWPTDQRVFGIGYVCMHCGGYMDKKVEIMLKLTSRIRVQKILGRW